MILREGVRLQLFLPDTCSKASRYLVIGLRITKATIDGD